MNCLRRGSSLLAVQAQKEDFIVNGVSVVGYDAGLHGEGSLFLLRRC